MERRRSYRSGAVAWETVRWRVSGRRNPKRTFAAQERGRDSIAMQGDDSIPDSRGRCRPSDARSARASRTPNDAVGSVPRSADVQTERTTNQDVGRGENLRCVCPFVEARDGALPARHDGSAGLSAEDPVAGGPLRVPTQPHFTTIEHFVSTLGADIAPIFAAVLAVCDRQGLIGREIFAIDRVKLDVAAARREQSARAISRTTTLRRWRRARAFYRPTPASSPSTARISASPTRRRTAPDPNKKCCCRRSSRCRTAYSRHPILCTMLIDGPAGRAQYGQRFATVEPVLANQRHNKRRDFGKETSYERSELPNRPSAASIYDPTRRIHALGCRRP